MRPVIGITANTQQLKNDEYDAFKINYNAAGFSEGITLAGGLPLLIPINQPELAKEYVESIDGLLITGGQDISPSLYHEEPRQLMGAISPLRDASEVALIKEAIKQNKAILGVCRGHQLINVILGGSLYQDLSENPQYTIQHAQKAQPVNVTHSVKINPDSYLSKIMANNQLVNSIHHQAIKEMNPILTASAWASDGLVEAAERIDDHYNILSIQWHPELTFQTESSSLKLFEDLVQRSK